MNQVGQVVIQNTKQRLWVGCLTLLIGVPLIACCLLAFFSVVLPELETVNAGNQSGSMPMLLLGLGIVLVLIMLLVPIIAVGFVTQKRARMLDSIFRPFGLQGQMYLLIGRHYWGEVDGRRVDIYLYRGPTLEIRLSSHSKTRVQIYSDKALPSKISGFLHKNPMLLDKTPWADYAVYAEDENWTRVLMNQPAMPEIIHSLMNNNQDWAIFRHVEIQPDEVLLYLHRSKELFIRAGQFSTVQTWLKNLADLAAAAEMLPAPSVQSTPLPGLSHQEREKKSKFLLIAVLTILIGLPICLVGIGILAYFLAQNFF